MFAVKTTNGGGPGNVRGGRTPTCRMRRTVRRGSLGGKGGGWVHDKFVRGKLCLRRLVPCNGDSSVALFMYVFLALVRCSAR